MKKTTIYSTLLLTSLALNQAVLADEIIAPAGEQPGIVSPTEPSQPVIPTVPATTNPVEPAPADPVTPGETEETKPVQPTEPVAPVQPSQPTDPVHPIPDQPTQPKTPEPPTEPSQPKEVEQSSQSSQTSQTPAATNPSAPVTPIVRSSTSTEATGEQPIIDVPASSEKSAEEVVVTPKSQIQSSKTAEKTTEPKKSEQTLERLPDTGTADSSLLSFLGATALGLVGLVLHKKQKKNGSV